MTKNGEMASTRAMLRPGNFSLNSTASSVPSTTVMTRTAPTNISVFCSETQKSGSVTR